MACKRCGYNGEAFPCPNCWGPPVTPRETTVTLDRETTVTPRETTPIPHPVVSQPHPVVSRQQAWKQRQGETWRKHHAEYMKAYRGRRAG